MYRRLLTLTLALIAGLLVIGLMPVHGEEEIYESVVRLHVIADSDSEEDQRLKLCVRDAVLNVTNPRLAACTTQKEALECLASCKEEIVTAARAALDREGSDDDVEVLIGVEEYPKRSYDSFCFPAGEYVSLRVRIGRGEGKNWWCCLFPPMCLGAATVSRKEAEDACISVGLTPSQYQIITESDKPVYRVRFKVLELFSEMR